MAKARPELHTMTQSEIATLLGLSTRQVRNLVDQGAPGTKSVEGKLSFDGPVFTKWYWERKMAAAVEAASPPDEWDSRARKETAQARMIEYDLAEREKRMINVEKVADDWARAFVLINDILLTIDGKTMRFVGLRTPGEAKAQCRQLRIELQRACSVLGGDQSFEDDKAV